MSISRAELEDAARRAFGESGLAQEAQQSWSLIAEMGWLAMTVPEELGGLGLGREAVAVIHSELGRALVRGPAIAQMMVITALSAADDLPERDELLARAMGGEIFAASLALPGFTARHGAVCDADRASHMLIQGEELVALAPLEAPGVTITRRPTWDETRRLFDVEANRSPEWLVLAEGKLARALRERISTQMLLAIAADSLGGAATILERTVSYLNTRRQFDRPLAMFQALKHRCADLKTRMVTAEALLWSFAAVERDDLVRAGALKAHATKVYADVAEEAIQLHGGIGLTEEHESHLFLKRALLNLNIAGGPDEWELAAGHRALSEASA